jgi:putative spermidine/putrescine transport system permease protein
LPTPESQELTDRTSSLDGGRTDGAAPAARAWVAELKAWSGLLPFFAFLFLFLLLPAYGVVEKAFADTDGNFSTAAFTGAFTDERQAFWGSMKVSFVTALLGVIFGTVLAYTVATATRPRWLRSMVSSFSGVAANMGGVILAFLFITLLGRQGLGTKLLRDGTGYDLYGTGWFDISTFWGWTTVYLYFQIPLMVLVTLPAIDGLKPAWREASSNLGGTTWTYWRRVGIPVLTPSMLGGFLLLFANAFSAYATVYALNTQSNLLPVKISFGLRNDVGGRSPAPYALATWMIIIIAVAMGGYLVLRKRSERWRA